MEPAKLIINHIFCPLHESELVRKVAISTNSDLNLLCIDCKEGNQSPERYSLETFLRQIVQSSSHIPKLQQLPDSTSQILNTSNEIAANFRQHIEKQKEQLNTFIDALKQSIIQKLEIKKQLLLADFDAQLKAFENILSFHKQKVYQYKAEPQDERTTGGQDKTLTFESLYKEVSAVKNATDLKGLLDMYHTKMKETKIFSLLKDEEAKKVLANAIEALDTQFIEIQASKPAVSFGVNNESFEEMLKRWNDQVDAAVDGLKIQMKNPVKPMKFQIQLSMHFDSVILKNDLPNQTMIVNWVSEATKGKRSSLKLLYRGSRDGFEAKKFHEKCDKKGPTLMIVENTTGNKFGGYASVSWTSDGGDIRSKESFSSFLFSIDKKEKLPYNPESDLRSLYHLSTVGPCFGNASALLIADNCNINSFSFSSDGCNSYQKLKDGGYVSGTYYFVVKEIEVYSVVP